MKLDDQLEDWANNAGQAANNMKALIQIPMCFIIYRLQNRFTRRYLLGLFTSFGERGESRTRSIS
jgi:hypothetical protein